MLIQIKKQSFHIKIKNQQRTQYFNKVRQAKIKQIQLIQHLQNMSEHQILKSISNESNQIIAFDMLYSYLELHNLSISKQFATWLSQTILTNYRVDINALYCLCILIDRLKVEFLQNMLNEMNLLLIENIKDVNNAQLVVVVIYKVFIKFEEKGQFKWFIQYYQQITCMLGCNQIVLFLFAQLSKYSGFEISQQILNKILAQTMEYKDRVSLQKVCELITNVNMNESIDASVKWLEVRLQTHVFHPQLINIYLNCIYKLLIKYGKHFIFRDRHMLHELMIIAINGGIQNRIIALRCICNIIIQAEDNQIVIVIQNYSICEAIALALQLQLSNQDKFNLLACSSLLFKLDPQCINNFQRYGALKYIVYYSNSECEKLREMSCLILDQNQKDYQ